MFSYTSLAPPQSLFWNRRAHTNLYTIMKQNVSLCIFLILLSGHLASIQEITQV